MKRDTSITIFSPHCLLSSPHSKKYFITSSHLSYLLNTLFHRHASVYMFTLTLVVTLMSAASGNRLPHHYASSSTRNQLWSAGSNSNNNHHPRQYQTQRQRIPHADNKVSSERDHRWVDPCRAKPLPSTFQGDQSFDPHIDKKRIFETIITASHFARHSGEKTKKKFIKEVMESDASIETKLELWRQKWLPQVPSVSDRSFQEYSNPTSAIIKVFNLLQYFAVGMQQVMIDVTISDGKMWQDIKKIETQLYQLTCEIRLAMYIYKIEPDPYVRKDVMGQEYKDISKKSTRNIRDFLILRDYVNAVNFTHHLFIHLRKQLNPSNGIV